MQNPQVWENKKFNTKSIKTKSMPNVFANMQRGSDLWITPEWAVEIIIPYLTKFKNQIIWCPFDTKESQFVKVLKKHKYNVEYSHLEYNQDFFNYEPNNWDILISNPPWSIKDKVLKRCYEFNKPFALILPIHSLSGKFRYSKFKENKIQLLITENRICFDHKTKNKHNRPPFESAYFCYKFLPKQICFEKK